MDGGRLDCRSVSRPEYFLNLAVSMTGGSLRCSELCTTASVNRLSECIFPTLPCGPDMSFVVIQLPATRRAECATNQPFEIGLTKPKSLC